MGAQASAAPALTPVRRAGYVGLRSPANSLAHRHLAQVPKRSFRVFLRPAGCVLIAFAAAGTLDAQTGTVRVARENFRSVPSGPILAEIVAGTELPLGARQDRWRQATLEGWIWEPSIREERAEGHDLVVSARRGENLRTTPNGPITARLRTGMRLDRVESRDRWIRVRRVGWVWEPSLELELAPDEPPPLPPGTPAGRARAGAGQPAARPAEGGTAPASSGARGEYTVAGPAGTTLLESPQGDTLARVVPGASVQVLSREGNLARVRVEGWTFAASLGGADTAAATVLRDISTAELAEDPDRYRGRLVDWSIQFIAMQEAERFRTDFLEGEPFILARGPGDEPGFVYVAVPSERVDEVRGLAPLQRVRVLGRVRAARSALTGAPVLDLLELRAGGSR